MPVLRRRTAILLMLLIQPAFADVFTIPTRPSTEPEPERKVSVEIVIDCHDIGLTGTSSADELKVELFDNAGLAASKKVNLQKLLPNPLDPKTCPTAHIDGIEAHWWLKPLLVANVTTTKDTLGVRLTATGADAIWIDRLRIVLSRTAISGKTIDFGVDGKKGWCLSTKSSDSFGSDRQDGKCKKCVEFVSAGAESRSCDR
jgi:hypothetical protein